MGLGVVAMCPAVTLGSRHLDKMCLAVAAFSKWFQTLILRDITLRVLPLAGSVKLTS